MVLFERDSKKKLMPGKNFVVRIFSNYKTIGVHGMKFEVYKFENPVMGGHVIFVNLLQVKESLCLVRSDATDNQWIRNNWCSWESVFEAFFNVEEFPAFRSANSASARHAKEKGPRAIIGETCMESWCVAPIVLIWMLLRWFKTLRDTAGQHELHLRKRSAARSSCRRCAQSFGAHEHVRHADHVAEAQRRPGET